MIWFTVPGEPVGKERPRSNFRGSVYTPAKTRIYENLVIESYMSKYGDFKFDDNAMLKMNIVAFYGIPKRVSKIKWQRMINDFIRPTKKPDLDNIIKIIADALNKVAYKDDSAIVDVRCIKKYSETPKVLVEIEEIKEVCDEL